MKTKAQATKKFTIVEAEVFSFWCCIKNLARSLAVTTWTRIFFKKVKIKCMAQKKFSSQCSG